MSAGGTPRSPPCGSELEERARCADLRRARYLDGAKQMDFERGVESGFIEQVPEGRLEKLGIHCPVYFSRQAIAKHVTFSDVKRSMDQAQKARFDDFHRKVSRVPRRFSDIVQAWKHSVSLAGEGARSVHEFKFMTYTRMGLEEASMVCVAISADPSGAPVIVFMVPEEATNVLDKIS